MQRDSQFGAYPAKYPRRRIRATNSSPLGGGSGWRQRRTAFSLIELLVVIAVISLLVSILLPSLQQAKELTRQTVCTTQVRHILMGYEFAPMSGMVISPVFRGTMDSIARMGLQTGILAGRITTFFTPEQALESAYRVSVDCGTGATWKTRPFSSAPRIPANLEMPPRQPVGIRTSKALPTTSPISIVHGRNL